MAYKIDLFKAGFGDCKELKTLFFVVFTVFCSSFLCVLLCFFCFGQFLLGIAKKIYWREERAWLARCQLSGWLTGGWRPPPIGYDCPATRLRPYLPTLPHTYSASLVCQRGDVVGFRLPIGAVVVPGLGVHVHPAVPASCAHISCSPMSLFGIWERVGYRGPLPTILAEFGSRYGVIGSLASIPLQLDLPSRPSCLSV